MIVRELIEILKEVDQSLDVALACDAEGNQVASFSNLTTEVLEKDGHLYEIYMNEYEHEDCTCHLNPPCNRCVNTQEITHVVLWP